MVVVVVSGVEIVVAIRGSVTKISDVVLMIGTLVVAKKNINITHIFIEHNPRLEEILVISFILKVLIGLNNKNQQK